MTLIFVVVADKHAVGVYFQLKQLAHSAQVKKHAAALQGAIKYVLILCASYLERRLRGKRESYCVWMLRLLDLDSILWAANILEGCKMVESLEDTLD